MSTLILLRHGESVWNRDNRFTGWTDVGLTERGVAEAIGAGEALREAGLEPRMVHTSLLSRSLVTLHHTLEAMDRLWLPVVKDWRLNERHYGALQGLNKAETAAEYGAEQVLLWRRSFDVPPPPVGVDDPRHPSHDIRYADVPAAELPMGESLRDVIARMAPSWQRILADLTEFGSVLVVAHGNSLRPVVKNLDGLTDEELVALNIPTGIPLVYELDDAHQPLTREYLGDPEAVAAAEHAVATQHEQSH